MQASPHFPWNGNGDNASPSHGAQRSQSAWIKVAGTAFGGMRNVAWYSPIAPGTRLADTVATGLVCGRKPQISFAFIGLAVVPDAGAPVSGWFSTGPRPVK
jgi:uncharacterized membrane protein